MPVRFAMCNEFCEGWPFERVCRLAAETGYEGIELAPFTLSDSVEDLGPAERDALRDCAERHGIGIVGLHWLLVKPEGLYINHPNEAIRRRTTRYLHAEVDFCADLGGRVMIVGSPKQRNVLPEDTYAATWDRTVEVFRELGSHAAERGVCLCLEPLGANETNFLATAGEVLRMVEAIGRPAVRMMLDVKAMCAEAESIPEIIRRCAPQVKHFHANDENLCGPGFGRTDLRPAAAALEDVGYEGYVSVEVFDFSPGPQAIARESLRYLKEVFEP